MANVEVGGTIEQLRQEPNRRVDTVAERIAGDRLGVVIERLRPGIGGLQLEAVCEPLVKGYVQGMVIGIGVPIDVTDNPQSLVELRTGRAPRAQKASGKPSSARRVA